MDDFIKLANLCLMELRKMQRDILETAIANVDRQIQPCLPFDE